MTRLDLSGCFGMYEMEQCAAAIIAKIRNAKEGTIQRSWSVGLCDMETDQERNGFLHLIEGGFLQSGTYNGYFVVTDSFIDRIKGKIE